MKKTIICIIIPVLLLASCHGDPVPCPSETVVHINTSLTEAGAATRAPIFGTNFPGYLEDDRRGTYGIFVCQNGTIDRSHAHKSNSYNLRAKYSDGSWSYSYVSDISNGSVTTLGTNNLTLTKRDDNATADLYAYAPYTQGAYVAGPTAIPYRVNGENTQYNFQQADLMYAVQNKATFDDDTDEQDGNENLNPSSSTSLNASFTFKHAFSLLAFRFKLKNDASSGAFGTGTTYTLSNITATLNDPDSDGNTTAKLYQSGTFNAITGSFNNDRVEVSSLGLLTTNNNNRSFINITSASDYTTTYLMLVPTDVADDELVFTFTVNGQTLQPFSLKRSYVQHGSSGVYGFQPGYQYTFSFTLDNYLYLDGISVGEWTTPIDPLGEQEI